MFHFFFILIFPPLLSVPTSVFRYSLEGMNVPFRITSSAFGAYKVNVTELSGLITGDLIAPSTMKFKVLHIIVIRSVSSLFIIVLFIFFHFGRSVYNF